MSKIYKVEVYIIDMDDDLQGVDDAKYYVKEQLGDIGNLIEVTDIEESSYFEWDDDLKINHTSATKEDYEKHFNR